VVAAPATRGGYRPDIDGLRAVAVLLVVAYHASPDHVPGGFLGVDVFFVISGFLITGLILDGLAAGTFSLLQFYARRCRRIVPALVVVLAATLALAWRTLLPGELDELGKDLAAGGTFTTNLLLWMQAGYFATAGRLKPLLHLWSLGVEEQFYLVWPVLLAAAFRRRLRIVPLAAGLAVASFALNAAMMPHHSVAAYYLLPTRFWELLAGALLAAAERRSQLNPGALPPVAREAVGIAALAAVAGASLVLREERTPWFVPAAVGTLASAAIVAIGPRAWIGRLLSARPLVVVGLMSYPLYLWHWPLLSIATIVEEGAPDRTIRAALVCASLVLAWLTWQLVERPIRERLPVRASRGRMVRFIAVSVAALAAIAGAGLAVHGLGGLPGRLSALEEVRAQVSYPAFAANEQQYPKCSGAFRDAKRLSFCFTSKPGEPAAAILGDSHADHLFPGIAAASPENWLLLAHNTCPPVFDVPAYRAGTPEECSRANQLAVGVVAAHDRIRTVVVASAYLNALDLRRPGLAPFVLTPPSSAPGMTRQEVFAYGLEREVAQLEAPGRVIVLFVDVPALNFAPTSCVDARPLRLTSHPVRTPCAVPRADVDRSQAPYRAAIAQVARAHPGVRVYDPAPLFCDAAWCRADRDGALLYRDEHHLNLRGSRYVASQFLPWLASAAR